MLLLVMLFTVFAPQNGVSGTAVQSYGALTATECAWQPGQMLIPGGSAFGIKLFTKGVVIVGTTDVQTAAGLADPAAEAGLEPGDVIISIDGSEVNTVEETKEKIGASGGRSLSIEYERGGERISTVLTPVLSAADNEYRGGIWVRDSTAGIGTVTYVNAADGSFGGLGHADFL